MILSKAERDVEVTTGKSAGVKYLIQHILNEEQIKNIKKEKKWYESCVCDVDLRSIGLRIGPKVK